MDSLFALVGSILVIAAVIFVLVKLHQIASHLAVIAYYYRTQQGAPPVKPHNLSGFAQKTPKNTASKVP